MKKKILLITFGFVLLAIAIAGFYIFNLLQCIYSSPERYYDKYVGFDYSKRKDRSMLLVSTNNPSSTPLDQTAIDRIKSLKGIREITKNTSLAGRVSSDSDMAEVALNGVVSDYFAGENLKFLYGSTFVQDQRKVIVVDNVVLKLLGIGEQAALGKPLKLEIYVDGQLKKIDSPYKIIGVVNDESSRAYLPISEFEELSGHIKDYALTIKVDKRNSERIKQEILAMGYNVEYPITPTLCNTIRIRKGLYEIFGNQNSR